LQSYVNISNAQVFTDLSNKQVM